MEALRTSLTALAPYAPYILFALALLAVLLVLLLVVLTLQARLRAKRQQRQEAAHAAVAKQAEMAAGAPAPATDGVPGGGLPEPQRQKPRGLLNRLWAPLSLRRSFRRAMRLLRHNVAGSDYRYQTPWFLMLGRESAGCSTFLRNSNLNLPMGRPVADTRQRATPCNWWFFDQGVVLDIDGRFILEAGGLGSDERGWLALLRLLQWHRPRRPIDGIILALPADDLVGPNALPSEELATYAEQLYLKLWELQKRLGLRLPVYVVVTRCDAVQGFSELAGALPDRLHDQIFGWSSPYALGTAYSAGWLDEAFAGMRSELLQLEANVLAHGRVVEDADAVLTFPGRFAELFDPLRLALDELFKNTAYHESFLFRGVYFVGDDAVDRTSDNIVPGPRNWEQSDAAGDVRPPREAHPVFVRHLLERKIFAEHGLARPTTRRLAYQSRAVRLAQAGVVATLLFGGIGLAYAYYSLSGSAALMEPFVRETQEDLSELAAKEAAVRDRQQEIDLTIAALQAAGVTPDELPQRPRFEIDKDFFTESALRLLQSSGEIDAQEFSSWLIPTSWFSRLGEKVRLTLALAYEQIILRSVSIQLHQKAASITDPGRHVDVPPPADTRVRFVQDTSEYIQLRDYVETITTLERNIRIYNGLQDATTSAQLNELVDFSFGVALPELFAKRAHGYSIRFTDPRFFAFDITRYRHDAGRKALSLNEALSRRIFEGNALVLQLDQLQKRVDELRKIGNEGLLDVPTPLVLEERVGTMQQTLAAIDGVRSAIASPEMSWLSRTEFNPGADHARLLADISTSAFLGEQVMNEIARRNAERFHKLRTRLGDYQSAMVGPLLAHRDDNLSMELSAPAADVARALSSFLSQEFIAATSQGGGFLKAVPSDRRLTWDNTVLEKALKTGESFDLFLNFELGSYPAALRNGFEAVAFARLSRRMSGLIGEAQRLSRREGGTGYGRSEQELLSEIRKFRTSSELLRQLHDTLDRLQLIDAGSDFRTLMISQAVGLLSEVDGLLQNARLYLPQSDLSWWDGNGPLNIRAYGTSDRTELAAFLGLQRQRLEYLAFELAQPLIEFLGQRRYQSLSSNVALIFRWQRILLELEGYRTARTGNSVALLEDYVLNDLAQVRGADCAGGLRSQLKDTGDFLLQRRVDIARVVEQRCSQLTDHVVRRRYEQLQGEFNRRLADRFPFAEGVSRGDGGDAGVAEVREFFKLYDRTVGSDPNFVETVKAVYGSNNEAIAFLQHLTAVRAFFAPWLDNPEDKGGPYYDYEVDFRVARDDETGGNQIIDWSLQAGGKRVNLYDAERKGRWKAGEPVGISLRWASGAAVAPVQDGRRSDMHVDGREAVFSYKGNWSLLRLIAANARASTEFRGQGDVDPHVLSFRVPLRLTGPAQRAQSTTLDPAQVFIRLRLSLPPSATPGGAGGLLVMPVFPQQAPQLVVAANGRGAAQ